MIPPPVAGGASSSRRCYVYLLRSRQDGTLYLGWTTSLLRRLVEHNEGLAGFSRRKRPWQLVGFETYPNLEQAKARERALKHHPRMFTVFKKRVLNQAASGGQRQVVG